MDVKNQSEEDKNNDMPKKEEEIPMTTTLKWVTSTLKLVNNKPIQVQV